MDDNQLKSKKNRLNSKDIHCITRVLQSTYFRDDMFYSCQYCKFFEECSKSFLTTKEKIRHFDKVVEKLQKITGLSFSPVSTNSDKRFKI